MNNILILFLLLSSNIFSQDNEIGQLQWLTGTWKIANKWPSTKDTLVFSRVTGNQPSERKYGMHVTISADGSIIKSYFVPCAIDSRLREKNDGYWHLDETGAIITFTIPIQGFKKAKILELLPDRMVFVKLE